MGTSWACSAASRAACEGWSLLAGWNAERLRFCASLATACLVCCSCCVQCASAVVAVSTLSAAALAAVPGKGRIHQAGGAGRVTRQGAHGEQLLPAPPRCCPSRRRGLHCTYPHAHTAFSEQPAAASYGQWRLVDHVLLLALAELVRGAQRLDDAWQGLNSSPRQRASAYATLGMRDVALEHRAPHVLEATVLPGSPQHERRGASGTRSLRSAVEFGSPQLVHRAALRVQRT